MSIFEKLKIHLSMNWLFYFTTFGMVFIGMVYSIGESAGLDFFGFAVLGSVLVAAVVTGLLGYLRGDASARSDREVYRRIVQLERSFVGVDNRDRGEMLEEIKSTLNEDLAKELETRYSEKALANTKAAIARSIYQDTDASLHRQLSDLGRRTNLNLVIGIITTSVAVAILIYMVFVRPVEFKELNDLLAHYVPWLSVVAFVEIFSFFFLRLYRSGLDEIKYYQSQIVLNANRRVAYETAMDLKDSQVSAGFVAASVAGEHSASEQVAQSLSIADVAKLTEALEKLTKTVGNISQAQKP